MAGHEEMLLTPNPADPREMEVFASVPTQDQQAWLNFVHSSHERESISIRPAYTFDQFHDGLAAHIEGCVPLVDNVVRKGIGGVALIPNFDDEYSFGSAQGEFTVDPLLGIFNGHRGLLERERQKHPVALIAPHASLASPYLIARSLIHTMGEEISNKLYIVIGPRPTVMDFEMYDRAQQKTVELSPVLLGRVLAHLILTGPDTESSRKNTSLHEWLKTLRKDFWGRLDEVVEPAADGDNNIVIFCPAGRVAEEGKEFRVDGSFEYLTKYPELRIWPVGIFDQVLKSAGNPGSPVFVNPDASMWPATNEKHANWLHERATILSQSPLGGLELERPMAQNARLAQQYIRRRAKGKSAPYLSE